MDLLERLKKAVEIAQDFGIAQITVDMGNSKEPDITVLVWDRGNTDERIVKALKYVPRLRRYMAYADVIWADAKTPENIKIDLSQVGKCVAVEVKEEVEEPEMIPTGRTVKRIITKTKYVCPEGITK
jgi:hypothetical protein